MHKNPVLHTCFVPVSCAGEEVRLHSYIGNERVAVVGDAHFKHYFPTH